MNDWQSDVYISAEDALERVRNVFCVGRNYRDHALELGNAVPSQPLIFGKPTHSVAPVSGVVVLPEGRTNIHHEVELVLWMKTVHRPGDRFEDTVGGVALGLDLTDRDAQSRLKSGGQPWEFAKGFRGSALVTGFHRVSNWARLTQTTFQLLINEEVVQQGEAKDMLFDFQYLTDYVATHFFLGKDDILFTGTPAGVGPLSSGDALELRFAEEVWGRCMID